MVFKNFPGPGKMETFFQRLSRTCGHSDNTLQTLTKHIQKKH